MGECVNPLTRGVATSHNTAPRPITKATRRSDADDDDDDDDDENDDDDDDVDGENDDENDDDGDDHNHQRTNKYNERQLACQGNCSLGRNCA